MAKFDLTPIVSQYCVTGALNPWNDLRRLKFVSTMAASEE